MPPLFRALNRCLLALVASLAPGALAGSEPPDGEAAFARVSSSEGVVLVDLWADW